MKKSSTVGKQVLLWLPFVVTLVLFLYAVGLRNGVPVIAEESKEVVKTATYLDSPDSLKTLIKSLDRQVQYASMEWDFALSMLLFALFITTAIAAAFWFILLSTKRKLEQLEQQKEEHLRR